jgi:peptidyl-prolyl cis-trans isomerase SurA
MTISDLFSKTRCFFIRCLSGGLALGLLCLMIPKGICLAEEPEVVDRIVAVVNDDIVVLQEIDKLLEPLKTRIQTAGYPPEQMRSLLFQGRQRIINQLIDEKLINQAAVEHELVVEPKEIDEAIERIKEANQFSDEQLRQAVEQEGINMATLRAQLKDQILASRLENIEVRSKIVITKEDVTDYYNKNADKYRGEKTYHLRNILIKAPETGSDAEKKAVDDKIQQIFTELKSGTSFEDVAKKYSESPFASEGGELGKFKLNDLSPNLRAAIEPLSAGEMTAALETSEGYQILFVQEILQEPGTSLESAYSNIEEQLFEEEYKAKKRAWTESLRKNAHIKIIEESATGGQTDS